MIRYKNCLSLFLLLGLLFFFFSLMFLMIAPCSLSPFEKGHHNNGYCIVRDIGITSVVLCLIMYIMAFILRCNRRKYLMREELEIILNDDIDDNIHDTDM